MYCMYVNIYIYMVTPPPGPTLSFLVAFTAENIDFIVQLFV